MKTFVYRQPKKFSSGKNIDLTNFYLKCDGQMRQYSNYIENGKCGGHFMTFVIDEKTKFEK